MTVPFQIVQ